jgi:anaerobic selenocysteine-containing dehydrogenase
MILLLALSGHVGKPGGGLRIGAWWQMTLNYDPNPPELLAGRAPVRDVEKMMKSMTDIWTTTSPTMVWLYAHDEGFARVVNESAYHDPAYPREIAEYAREAIEKRWMPVHPRPGTRPRVFLYTGMNPLRRWPIPHVIRDNLWAKMKLIVCWDFRMSTSAMYSDIVLPAAGWHEKAGVKFAQSYVPYICVGDEAVPPLYESKNEFDIMAIISAKIQERARERELGSYLDATGAEHDPKHIHEEHTVDGEFGEGQASRALDAVLKRSLPTENTTVEEATRKGAIRVKRAGEYGPLTAICSDLEADQPLHPFDWFVRDKQPWPTLTGRQQFYIDHPWYLEVGEELPVHKEEPKAGGDHPLRMSGGHTRWSIHAIWRTNRLMLRLQRGQPVAYVNPEDAQARGIADHDQVWIYNDIGGFKVHAKLAPGVQPGQVMIYHAWEPYQFEGWMGSQTVVPSAFKPLHLVGDYGHLQYRFALGQPSHVCRNMAVEMEKT